MKMLFFDFRESEQKFFDTHELKDFEIEFINEPLNENTYLTEKQLNDTDAVSVFITSTLNENVLKKFKNLRIISTRSTGYNHIDVKYCRKKRISVFNVSGYGQTSVAQYTMMLMIALVRNLKPAYLDIKRNGPDYPNYEGRDINNLSLGIIGYGSIGQAVAKLANAFGMTVYVNCLEKTTDTTIQYLTLDELIRTSDIITLHLPYNSELYHMIGRDEISKMKDGVYIINTARGELIDSVALYEAIMTGKVKGAALDVFECESLAVKPDGITSNIEGYDKNCVANALIAQKLIDRDNVILTPHIAYNTQESIYRILEITFNNLRDYCKGLHTNQIY